MQDLSTLFKLLGDRTRLRLAVLLAIHGETCVCRLAEALDAPDFKISRHLGIMRAAGLVTARRKGVWMYYTLAEPRHDLERHIQEGLRNCLADHADIKADTKRLNKAVCAKE